LTARTDLKKRHAFAQFGGDWTTQKLQILCKYLTAYATIMKKQRFRFAYIDAFAGTGYRKKKESEVSATLVFPGLKKSDARDYLDGSARIALQVQPAFDKYIFIEIKPKRYRELARLRDDFPNLADRIELINADCNSWLQERCLRYSWQKHRAVLFLDPFGMQVEWETIRAIARTQAMDVLILFPLGVAVNRLLQKDGEVKPAWRASLDRLFGTPNWYEAFYRVSSEKDLFKVNRLVKKEAAFSSISRFYIDRLKTVFPPGGVAKSARPLVNSKGNPLYQLCFAAANPKGAAIAVRIAESILKG
jgi:three-Cys-motif partner protein